TDPLPLPGSDLATPGSTGAPAGTPPASYTEAKKEIDTTIQTQPKNFDLRMQAAQFYMKTGDYASAIPHLEVATKLSPKAVLPWIALGDAYALEQHFAPASQAYSHAAALDPNNPQIVRGRGQLLLLQRKWKEAEQVLENGVAHYPKDTEIRTVLGN